MDYYPGEITIPKKYLDEELLRRIENSLGVADAMKCGHSSDGGLTVSFHDEKAAYGKFPALEEYLTGHNIPFDRSSSGYYDNEPEQYFFRPGREVTLTGNDRAMPASVVRDVMLGAVDNEAAVERLCELLDTVYDPKVIPLAEYIRCEETADKSDAKGTDVKPDLFSASPDARTYSFDELPENIRDTLIEDNRDILVERDSEWYLPVYRKLCSEAAKYGLNVECGDISFSGFGAQGDGASFICPKERVNTYTLLREGRFAEKFPELADEKMFDDVCYSIDMEIKSLDNRYSHYNTVSAYGHLYVFDAKLEPLLERVVTEAEKYLDEVKDTLCLALYRNLENHYDDLRSDEKVAEALRERDELYYADGISTRGSAESVSRLAGRMTEEQQEKFIALMETDLYPSETKIKAASAAR